MKKLIVYIVSLLLFASSANQLSSQHIAALGQAAPSFAVLPLKQDVIATDSFFDQPTYVINLNVYEQNQVVYCNFKTEFKCHSYAIEGKQYADDAFKSLFYCNDELCVDSRDWVDISFSNSEQPYQYFRIKTVLANGEVHYSQVQFIHVKVINDVELVNTMVSGFLYFRINSVSQAQNLQYSITGVNGDIVKNESAALDGFVNLEALPAGFYVISFKAMNGEVYHYKFFKTANL